TDDELVELGTILEQDVPARRVYLQHLDLHAALSELGSLQLQATETLRSQGSHPKRSRLPAYGWLYGFAALVVMSLLTWNLVSFTNRAHQVRVAANPQQSLNVGQLS